MKNFNLIMLVLIGIFATSMEKSTFNSPSKNFQATKAAHIDFKTTVHDFGVIQMEADGSFTFTFKNTGKEPLVIQGVSTSCGCTVAKKPEAPILPGKSDVINVKYDTRRLGVFHKTITVTSNADNPSVVLTISGEVKAKPAEEAPVKPDNGTYTPTSK
ncbi:MAG: hypothetical protein AUJ98_10570 [Bacteroidetes bacterium CG2_30_33_31]|nr:MAG: hypothetical protein AUJ98_10570 [Bacteroidetes bacterium CG2_30_33_31]